MAVQLRKTGRPVWVWLISIFYLGFGLSGLMAVGMALIIHAQGSGPAGEAASLQTILQASLWGILPAANIAGAISLFLMRKIAFYIFSGLLVVKACLQLLLEDALATVFSSGNAQMIIGYGLGYGILLAVCIYSRYLAKTGVLR